MGSCCCRPLHCACHGEWITVAAAMAHRCCFRTAVSSQAGGVFTVVVSVLYATMREGDQQLSWTLVAACGAVVLGTHHLLVTNSGQDSHNLGTWTLMMSAGDTGGGLFHDDDESAGGDTGANTHGGRMSVSAHVRRVRRAVGLFGVLLVGTAVFVVHRVDSVVHAQSVCPSIARCCHTSCLDRLSGT